MDAYSYDNLVGKIAGFTSLRDVDLLELSLLKTIYAIMNPIEASLVTIDSQNNIRKKIDYASGHHGTISTEEKATEVFIEACEQLDATALDYCTLSVPNGSLSLFLLSQDRKLASYVSIKTGDSGITKSQAEQTIGMLKIYRNFHQLLQESQTDELTGLANRKSFENTAKKIYESHTPNGEAFENERRNLNKYAHEFWVAMIDIDHFKKFNDEHGHLIGDEVLVRVSQTMQASLRKDDFLFRYGGEEFAAIIHTDSKTDCSLILERVRKAVEDIKFSNTGQITISIGAEKLNRNEFYLSIVEKADKALYHSKTEGRNQLSFYEDLSESANKSLSDESEIDLF